MKLFSMLPPLAKVLQFAQPNNEPLHAAEIYYLWEGLSAGNEVILAAETYLMNTEDTEIHILLQGLLRGVMLNRVQPLEKILKEEGFTVPPRPASKTTQGKPGEGQEVKLSDDEIIRNLMAWGQVTLDQDAKAVGACTRESVRKVFTDLLFDNMKEYSLLMELGNSRKVYKAPPPATAKDNSLNMDEVSRLWEEMTARHLSVINLEIYLSNTNDQALIKLLKRALNQVAIPQLEQLETILKEEGFIVPSRPVRRMNQGPPGQVSKIKLDDNEIIGVLTTAGQIAIQRHVRAYGVAIRKDIRKLFNDFASSEIEEYHKLLQLATQRHTLITPPVVTSRRG